MQTLRLALVLSAVLCGPVAHADVTASTPHDYPKLPKPGREGGTYAFTGYFTAGPPNCTGAAVGTAKFLPNGQGTGGAFCSKFNVEIEPACPLAVAVNSSLQAVGGTYTVNGDGTLCENAVAIGGPLDGTAFTFHTYVDPKGRWLLASGQDIAYPCPGIPPNGPVISTAIANKISNLGDDPPGSGALPCTNP